MPAGDALRTLARFLDELGAEGRASTVELVGRPGDDSGESLTADVEVTLGRACVDGGGAGEGVVDGGGVALSESNIAADGTLGLTFESTTPVVPETPRGLSVEVGGADLAPDGSVTVTLSTTVSAGDGSAAPGLDGPVEGRSGTGADGRDDVGADGDAPAGVGITAPDEEGASAPDEEDISVRDEPAAPSTGGRDRDVPPFRDPELLEEVYDSCATFAEMPAALGMDVTAETVRRYMIDYGIHEPTTYNTSRDDDEGDASSGGDAVAGDSAAEPDPDESSSESEPPLESPMVIADGIGLPDDVTVDTIIETVRASNTIYEVERDIGIEREDALEMLRELNLLDLVVGRLATESEREISRDEVVDRLRDRAEAA